MLHGSWITFKKRFTRCGEEYLVGLTLLPTIVSTATLAVATRNIRATKVSVLGVFEPITAILVGTLMFNEAFDYQYYNRDRHCYDSRNIYDFSNKTIIKS